MAAARGSRRLSGTAKIGRRPGWEGAVRAHREAFAGVDPATTTLYVAGFIPPGVLAEVELDAVLAAPPR